MRQSLELDELEQFLHFGADLRTRRPALPRPHFQTERDVLKYGHVPEQSVVLKHESNSPFADSAIADVLAIKTHVARIRKFQPGDNSQKRRLPGTGWSQQSHQFAAGDLQIDVVQRGELPEFLRDVDRFNAHAALL